MSRFFMCVLSLSLSGALTVLLILLVRPLTRQIFSRRWNYYIWLLVIFRLLLPVHIDLGGSGVQAWELFSGNEVFQEKISMAKPLAVTLSLEKAADPWQDLLAETGIVKGSTSPEPARGQGQGRRTKAPAEGYGSVQAESIASSTVLFISRSDIQFGLGICWLSGAVLCLCIKAKGYLGFIRWLKKECKPVSDSEATNVVGQLSRRLSIKKQPLVYESGEVSAPMVVGLLRPAVVLPERAWEDSGLRLAIHHELVHIKRKDLWYKWLYQILLCVHWFNPVLYLGARKLNADCELSCDEAVVAVLTSEGKKAYGNTLLNFATQSTGSSDGVFSVTLLERKEDLKVRLKGILKYKKQNPLKAAVSLGTAAGMIFLSACGCVEVAPDAMPVQISQDAQEEAGSFWDWAAMKVGSWADTGLDGFFSQPVLVDKLGEAWQVYEDDGLLAGDDICGQWHMYNYSGGKSIHCGGMYLNGSASVLIANAKEDVDIQVRSTFDTMSGRFKVVHIGPDGSVTVLNETGEKGSADVTFPAGRNVIKLVGQGGKISGLNVEYRGLQDWDFESILFSQEEEKGMIITKQVKDGVAEKEEIMEALPYLEAETVSQATFLLLKQQVELSREELSQLIVYSDSRQTVGYLVEAVKQGELASLDGELIKMMAPYLRDGDMKELLLCMGGELTPELLNSCVPHMKGDEIKELLVNMKGSLTPEIVSQNAPYLGDEGLAEVLLSMGGKLTGELVCRCAPYLEAAGLGKVLSALREQGELTGETVYKCAPYLGKSDLREVLVSMGEGMDFDLLRKCVPYLGESEVSRCLKEYLESGNVVTYSQIQKIAPYLSDEQKEELDALILTEPSED